MSTHLLQKLRFSSFDTAAPVAGSCAVIGMADISPALGEGGGMLFLTGIPGIGEAEIR